MKTRKFNQQYGKIVNFSTDSAQIIAGKIVYGSSKVALEDLTRSITIEVGYIGVTVNTVAPGLIQTGDE